MAAWLVHLLIHSICFLLAGTKTRVFFAVAVCILRPWAASSLVAWLWLKTHFIMHPPKQLLSHAKSKFPWWLKWQPKWLPSKDMMLLQPVCTYQCSMVVHRSTCCLPGSALWRCLPAFLRADTSTGSLSCKSSCGFPILLHSGVCQGHRRKWLQATVSKRKVLILSGPVTDATVSLPCIFSLFLT